MTIIEELNEQIKLAYAKIKEIQNECSHPLVARITVNKGNTGNWDRDDSYWTEHHCSLCDRRWHTDQSWQNTGDKRGMPENAPIV